MNLNEQRIFALCGLLCFIVIPCLMLILSYFYVNSPKYKMRLVELGFGLNNEWVQGKRIDFVESSMLFGSMSLSAYIFKIGHAFGKTNPVQTPIHPNLNKNQNYLKLINEFRFFSIWTISTFWICIFGAVCLFIAEGMKKGWF